MDELHVITYNVLPRVILGCLIVSICYNKLASKIVIYSFYN